MIFQLLPLKATIVKANSFLKISRNLPYYAFLKCILCNISYDVLIMVVHKTHEI